jgi:hypothetical protein
MFAENRTAPGEPAAPECLIDPEPLPSYPTSPVARIEKPVLLRIWDIGAQDVTASEIGGFGERQIVVHRLVR